MITSHISEMLKILVTYIQWNFDVGTSSNSLSAYPFVLHIFKFVRFAETLIQKALRENHVKDVGLCRVGRLSLV